MPFRRLGSRLLDAHVGLTLVKYNALIVLIDVGTTKNYEDL